MRRLLIKWFVMTIAVLVTAYLLPGIVVSGPVEAGLAALLLGLVNVILRPLLILLTLPLTILSFGLFLLLINALLLYLVAGIVDGFFIVSLGWAVLGSIIISIISWMINSMIRSRERQETR
ncbi:MAG: phage holin family protein [Candidatus Electryonea clarkiae]|nr:phage holin family protein [Candidatus Electryonea clarkiae]MDP8286731.1 phage holin family protein [Candidatus Electryonea clarkiae]